MRPRPQESPESFVLRVEDQRKRLRVDDKTTLRSFLPFLPAAIRERLNTTRCVAAALMGRGKAGLAWAMVVEQCLLQATTADFTGPPHEAGKGRELAIRPTRAVEPRPTIEVTRRPTMDAPLRFHEEEPHHKATEVAPQAK